ncbi:MAG: hypothetical protein HYV97_09230 [Bdellovibrio sp.]|nr:hypothetical protein [Bdellovibrio sp.]
MNIGPFSKYFNDEFNFAWRKLEEHLSSFGDENRAWCEADVLLQKRGLHYLRCMARHLPAPVVSEMLAMLAEYEALLPEAFDISTNNLKSCLEILHLLHQHFLKALDEMVASEERAIVKEPPRHDAKVLKFIVGDRLVDWSVASNGPQKFDSSAPENLEQTQDDKNIVENTILPDLRVQGIEFMAKIFEQTEIWPINGTSLMAVKQKLLHLKEIEGDKKLAHSVLDEVVRDFTRLEQRLACQTVLKPFQENGPNSLYVLGALHFSLIDESCSLPKQAVSNLLRGLIAVASYLPPSMSKCIFQLSPHLGKRGYVADLFCDEVGFFHWKQASKNLDNSKFGWEIVVLEEKCFFRIYLDDSTAKRSAFLIKSNDSHFNGFWAIPSMAVKRFTVMGKKTQEKIQDVKEIRKLPGHIPGCSTISLSILWHGVEFYLETQDLVGEELVTLGTESSLYAPYPWAISESGHQVIWLDLDLFLNDSSPVSKVA